MSIVRDSDGKVTLWDTVSNKALRVNAPTARENLKNNSARYVTKQDFDAMVNERKIDAAVAKKVEEATRKVITPSASNAIDDAIIEAHNKVLEEVGENDDDRLTQTRLLKKKVLQEAIGREVDASEYSKYSKFVQTARAAQAS